MPEGLRRAPVVIRAVTASDAGPHQAPIRIKALRGPIQWTTAQPLATWWPQKTGGAMPRPSES